MKPFAATLATSLAVVLGPLANTNAVEAEHPPAPAMKQARSYRLTQTERGQETVSTVTVGTAATDVDADRLTLDITSKAGIGRLVITLLPETDAGESTWPAKVTLRLKLKALAMIQIDNGAQTIISESLRGPKPRATYVTPTDEIAKQQQKNEVDADHPLHLTIRKVAGVEEEAAANQPAREAHFEVNVPVAFLKNKPKEVHIRWIDYYRG